MQISRDTFRGRGVAAKCHLFPRFSRLRGEVAFVRRVSNGARCFPSLSKQGLVNAAGGGRSIGRKIVFDCPRKERSAFFARRRDESPVDRWRRGKYEGTDGKKVSNCFEATDGARSDTVDFIASV